MLTILSLLVILWPLIAIPFVLMLFIRPAGRAVFFILGLIFFAGIGSLMDLGGPDSPGLAIPFAGLCLSTAAALAELFARAFGIARRRAAAEPKAEG
jgi:hypothetical protein